LGKQDELLELQEQLESMDASEKTAFFLRTRRQDTNTDRKMLLSEIALKLIEYSMGMTVCDTKRCIADAELDKLLESYYRHLERQKAPNAQLQSFMNWMDGNKPLVPTESAAYHDWEDFSTPHSPSDHGRLESLLESCAVGLKKRGMAWVSHIYNTINRLKLTNAGFQH
jgi:hypothetical protein